MTTREVNQPPMAWRYCGNQIKLTRIRAGVTREQLAQETNYDYESIKSMEQGRRRPTLRVLEIADEMCGAQGLLIAAAEYLKPEKFESYAQEFVDAESKAIVLHSYQTVLIPGQLQTEAYARALIGDHYPPLDDETVEERVGARLARKEMLKLKPTVLFTFIIYEAALRTLVGGAETMKKQLHHLIEMGTLRNVSVQVLPAGRSAHAALSGPLVLLETAEHEQYSYVEGQETGALYAAPEKVSILTQCHGMIRMQALDVEESARFISKVAEEL